MPKFYKQVAPQELFMQTLEILYYEALALEELYVYSKTFFEKVLAAEGFRAWNMSLSKPY